MILVDTSVWIEHLNRGLSSLRESLLTETIVMHPMVIGELACGHLPRRQETLQMLKALPQISEAHHDSVLGLIDTQHLMGRGIGYIDAHLICSAFEAPGTVLWTNDARLRSAAERLGVAYQQPHAP